MMFELDLVALSLRDFHKPGTCTRDRRNSPLLRSTPSEIARILCILMQFGDACSAALALRRRVQQQRPRYPLSCCKSFRYSWSLGLSQQFILCDSCSHISCPSLSNSLAHKPIDMFLRVFRPNSTYAHRFTSADTSIGMWSHGYQNTI